MLGLKNQKNRTKTNYPLCICSENQRGKREGCECVGAVFIPSPLALVVKKQLLPVTHSLTLHSSAGRDSAVKDGKSEKQEKELLSRATSQITAKNQI